MPQAQREPLLSRQRAAATPRACARLTAPVARSPRAQVLRELSQPPPPEAKFSVGEITERSLAYYNGRDWAKPLLLAVKGVVYDVTDAMDTYGPGAAARRAPGC